jgi:hypothetical protein
LILKLGTRKTSLTKSLTLDQAAAVITAARTLPVMELRPGLKDVRRPAVVWRTVPIACVSVR